jgi:GTPase Era involved in 16S rRNA processing
VRNWFQSFAFKFILYHYNQAVQDWAVGHLPEGPTLYPKDSISEHPERFFIAEIIREKIFLQYSQEVPYSTQVWVQSHTVGRCTLNQVDL